MKESVTFKVVYIFDDVLSMYSTILTTNKVYDAYYYDSRSYFITGDDGVNRLFMMDMFVLLSDLREDKLNIILNGAGDN